MVTVGGMAAAAGGIAIAIGTEAIGAGAGGDAIIM